MADLKSFSSDEDDSQNESAIIPGISLNASKRSTGRITPARLDITSRLMVKLYEFIPQPYHNLIVYFIQQSVTTYFEIDLEKPIAYDNYTPVVTGVYIDFIFSISLSDTNFGFTQSYKCISHILTK